MTHSLYSKFVLGYLLFGLLGFVLIATFSSHMTNVVRFLEKADRLGKFLFIEDPKANAKGYGILYQVYQSQNGK